MKLILKVLLLSVLLAMTTCQSRQRTANTARNRYGVTSSTSAAARRTPYSPSRTRYVTDEQGRTFGLIAPILRLGLGGLSGGGRPFGGLGLSDVPVRVGAGVQSDPIYGGNGGYGGGGYGGGGYGGGYGGGGYGGGFPNYGGGYQYGGFNPFNLLGGLFGGGGGGYRPQGYNGYGGGSLGGGNGGGYQQPINGAYAGLSNYASAGNGLAATGATTGGTNGVDNAQAAQVAGAIGQALGSSLRPLLAAQGGGGLGGLGGAGAGLGGAGGGLGGLGGLLSLLG